jgi:hypothetical protein
MYSIQLLQSKSAAKIILQISKIGRSFSPDDRVLATKEVLFYTKLQFLFNGLFLVNPRNAVNFLSDIDDAHVE